MPSPCARDSARSVQLVRLILVHASVLIVAYANAFAATDQSTFYDLALNPSLELAINEASASTVALAPSIAITPQLEDHDSPTLSERVGSLDQTSSDLIPNINFPPTALCRSATVCADHYSCNADVSVDAGSFDPNGDSLTQEQFPYGPYEIGIHTVTLTVADSNGATSQCTTTVIVEDCSPPDLLCPDAMAVQCQVNGASFVLPGTPHGKDCSDFVIAPVGELVLPLGQSIVVHSATDAFGLTTTCDQVIVVFDVDTDGDGLVDCLDLCPMVTAYGPFGCGGLDFEPLDNDGDGVFDEVDSCPTTPAGDTVDANGCTLPTVFVDSDADGVEDALDQCPDTSPGSIVDQVGCVLQPPEPPDSDGDGVADELDQCTGSPPGVEVDATGCSLDPPPEQPIPDSDGDGVNDEVDLCPNTNLAEVDDVGCPAEEDDVISPPENRSTRFLCGLCSFLNIGVTYGGLIALRFYRSTHHLRMARTPCKRTHLPF